MRRPIYLSPSALKCFEKDRDEYYLRYMADTKIPRMPQTNPMAAGSAFDAYVKSYIHHALFGNYGSGDAYELRNIFEAQVEPHVRDWAWEAGAHIFERYNSSGALADMMFELNRAIGAPRFEFSIQGVVDAEICEIPLLGKPDIFFINSEGARVIWDWKVNGYCARQPTSPTKGFVKCRDGWSSTEQSHSPKNHMPHPQCFIEDYLGIKINAATTLEKCNDEWADQEAIYGWLLGEPIGSEGLVFGIDQIVNGKGTDANGRPFLRIASHRTKISSAYQFQLLDRLATVWTAVTSGQLFGEYNDERMEMLERRAKTLANPDPMAQYIARTAR